MKLLVTFLSLISFCCVLNSQDLRFKSDRLIDYGLVKAGEMVRADVLIENVSQDTLSIMRVHTSCNCTSVDYPKHVLKPGEISTIKVIVDTKGKFGPETVVVRFLTSTSSREKIIRVDYDVN
ncbi:MAG: DUF1573 domain-containing protein [Bacteroidales bacterium]|nr:DUF1573 domain-containing protein [Bacteroidales bacterium]